MTLALRALDSCDAGFDAALAALLAYSAEADDAIEAQRRGDPRRRARARRRRGARVHAPLRRHRRRRRWPRSRSARDELARRARRAAAGAARRARRRRRAHPRLPRAPARRCGRSWSYRDADGSAARPAGDAARPRRHLRARRQGGVSVVGADERDAGEGRRRRRDRHGRCPTPGRRAQSAGARRGARSPASTACSRSAARRRSRALAYGTATMPAVDKIVGPGNAYVAAAKRRVFGKVGIDMIAGPSRDPGHRRRHDAARLGRDGPVLAGRARRAGAGDPALARRRATSTRVARGDRAAAAGACRARDDHPRLARGPRRARSVRASWTRRARSPTASRPSTSSSRVASPQRWLPLLRHAGAIFLGALHAARASATTAPARTTSCRPRAPRASRRRSASTTSRSAPA